MGHCDNCAQLEDRVADLERELAKFRTMVAMIGGVIGAATGGEESPPVTLRSLPGTQREASGGSRR